MTGVKVLGKVNADINKVWEVFRNFGTPTMEWWPIYKDMKIEGDGDDKVGCIRAFNTKTGRFYREGLRERDDDKKKLVYDLLEIKPSVPTLKTIVTTVQMTSNTANETIIEWSSEIDASVLVLSKIASVQEETYQAAIKSLNRYFNPSFGTLEVEIINATKLAKKGLFAPNPYVLVDIDGSSPKCSKVLHHTYAPRWNQTIELDVLNKTGKLNISVWDENILEHDDFLGAVEFDIHLLQSENQVVNKFTLSETDSGEISLAFTLKLVDGEQLDETDDVKEFRNLERVKHVFNELKDQALHTLQELEAADPKNYAYARYPRVALYPEVDYENLPRCVSELRIGQALSPHKLGRVVQRTTEYAYSQINFLDRAEKSKDVFSCIFGDWTAPNDFVIEHWDSDDEFCRQLLQGVNPMAVELCTDKSSIPDGLASLKAMGKSLEQLITDKELFILDYKYLDGIPQYRDMHFYAPYVLLYKQDGDLKMLGFQLTRKFDGSDEIFTPDMTKEKPNRYRFARIHVACADNQYHQFIEHLGFAHLAMEPFAIAHHNCFPGDHPIGKVLAPHFRDTIGINYLARQTLVSPIIPFTDRTFAPGTAGALHLFLKAYKEWDFSKLSFPTRMQSRGFDEKGSDGVKNFFYRDDGFLVWNCLKNYFSEIVETVYTNDTAIKADAVIQNWAKELNDPELGAVPGFPSTIDSSDALVDILTSVVFNVSAQHSAVNFSQYDYVSYVPNRPDSLFALMPESRDEITEAYIQKALPDISVMQFQASFAWILSMPSEHTLFDLEDSEVDMFKPIHQKYLTEFKKIAEKIESRNDKLVKDNKHPYPFLNPKNIAASVDI